MAGFLATVTRDATFDFPWGFAGAFEPVAPREAGRTRTGAAGMFRDSFFTDDFAASFLDITRPSPRLWLHSS
ncbi:MAG: hypothetical protein ACKO2P_13630, partial [Planctomycetota bacterium]